MGGDEPWVDSPQPGAGEPGPGAEQVARLSGVGGQAGADWLSRFLLPAHETKSWLKFLGVVAFAAGCLTALTVVGLLWAWLYIWLGVLLWQAGESAGRATALRDPGMLEQYLLKLKTIITIAGVVVSIGVLATGFALLVLLSIGWMGLMSALGEIFPH
jgi:hypothetical protein